jgi:hypothetical protein
MSKPTRPTRYILKNVLYAEEMGRVIVFADEMEYVSALEAENAELRKRQWQWVNAELSAKLTRAVKLLESSQICADANGHRALSRKIEDFLSEMGGKPVSKVKRKPVSKVWPIPSH